MPPTYCKACETTLLPASETEYCTACAALPHFERTLLAHLATIGNMLTGICMALDPEEEEGEDREAWETYTLADETDA